VDDATLLHRSFESLAASISLMARGDPANRLVERDGIVAVVSPGAPDRSVVNGVAYRDPAALGAALDELAAAYAEAGVRAWTVWVRPGDAEGVEAVEAAGHRLDATPEAMGLELADLRPPPRPEPEWRGDWDITAAGLINDHAYGDVEGMFGRAMGGLPEGAGHLYLARIDGRPASYVLVHDHGDDCVFSLAATEPDFRGRGLAGGLLHRALLDARERGCNTSTTQATQMGRPVYARVGYRDLGQIQMWERRDPR
jgi:GNAT superfamily N-acetyltransferase